MGTEKRTEKRQIAQKLSPVFFFADLCKNAKNADVKLRIHNIEVGLELPKNKP